VHTRAGTQTEDTQRATQQLATRLLEALMRDPYIIEQVGALLVNAVLLDASRAGFATLIQVCVCAGWSVGRWFCAGIWHENGRALARCIVCSCAMSNLKVLVANASQSFPCL
jgi:hypothetical protein